MVNFRFHVVSLIAVFLALGVGIVVGSTVIARGTLSIVESRLNGVEKNARQVDATNRRLANQLDVWNRFASQSRDQLLQGRLKDVPVMIVGVQGVDRGPVDELRHQLAIAQADFEGTVWLNRKLRVDNDADMKALAGILNVPADRADVVRSEAVSRLSTALSGSGTAGSLLDSLRSAAFVDFEPPAPPTPATTVDIKALAVTGTRFVVVSGAGEQVPDEQLAAPFTEQLAVSSGHVVAVESGVDTPGGRALFVGLLRSRSDVAGRVSSVDNLESFVGQTACVLALEDLAVPKFGQFGVGPGAQRLLPAAPPT